MIGASKGSAAGAVGSGAAGEGEGVTGASKGSAAGFVGSGAAGGGEGVTGASNGSAVGVVGASLNGAEAEAPPAHGGVFGPSSLA